MEETKTFMWIVGQLGGFAALSWCLFVLHKDAIKAFKEELTKERETWREVIAEERKARKEERDGQHREVTSQLDRIEEHAKNTNRIIQKWDG